jgi:hypothetical protein
MKPRGLIFILSIILLFGCQKEEPDPSGDPSENPSENPTEEPITTATIGTEGGILWNEQLHITVPAGSFEQDENVSLTELIDSSCFRDDICSESFKIAGLPESMSHPLKIAIAYEGEQPEYSFVLVGEEAMNMTSGGGEVYYHFIEATDSAGYLVCEFPGPDDEVGTKSLEVPDSDDAQKKWITVQVLSNFLMDRIQLESDYYKIYLPPEGKAAQVSQIQQYLDVAFDGASVLFKYLSTPLKMESYDIFLANLSDDVYCKFAWRNGEILFGKKSRGILAINRNKLDDPGMMQVMLGREVLRSVLFQFNPYYPFLFKPDEILHYWLDQAVITWSEVLFIPEAQRVNYVPSDFKGHELAPFNGMHAGILQGEGSLSEKVISHGCGMSAFINYLLSYDGSLVLSGIYPQIREGKHPVSAIESYITNRNSIVGGLSFELEYMRFFIEYLEGKHYGVSGETFFNSITQNDLFTIDDDEDTIHIFQDTYPDLSAKLFHIQLNDQEFREKGSLDLYLTGGSVWLENIAGYLFGYRDQKITRIGDFFKTMEAVDFGAYSSLILLVYNATATMEFVGNSTAELTIEADRSYDLPYTYCEVEISFSGDHLVTKDPPNGSQPYYSTYNIMNTWKIKGSCEDNIFTGVLDGAYHPDNTSGILTVEFDGDLNIVEYELASYDRNLVKDTVAWIITGGEVDKSYESGNYLRNELIGPSTCNGIDFIYSYSESTHVDGGKVQYLLMDHSCNDFSLLKFYFREE